MNVWQALGNFWNLFSQLQCHFNKHIHFGLNIPNYVWISKKNNVCQFIIGIKNSHKVSPQSLPQLIVGIFLIKSCFLGEDMDFDFRLEIRQINTLFLIILDELSLLFSKWSKPILKKVIALINILVIKFLNSKINRLRKYLKYFFKFSIFFR